MKDFSDWLVAWTAYNSSVSSYQDSGAGFVLIPGTFVLLILLLLIVVVIAAPKDKTTWIYVFFLGLAVILLGGGLGHYVSSLPTVPDEPNDLTTQIEKVWGLQSIECTTDLPDSQLPDDGVFCVARKDGIRLNVTIHTDGDKHLLGLYTADGNALKPAQGGASE